MIFMGRKKYAAELLEWTVGNGNQIVAVCTDAQEKSPVTAILPDWRGTVGYNIVILNKLSLWGVAAYYVDKTIDTGSIIRIYRFDFDYRTGIDLEKDDIDLKVKVFWFPPYDGVYIEIKGKKYTLVNNEILKSIFGRINNNRCFFKQSRYAVRVKYMPWIRGAA